MAKFQESALVRSFLRQTDANVGRRSHADMIIRVKWRRIQSVQKSVCRSKPSWRHGDKIIYGKRRTPEFRSIKQFLASVTLPVRSPEVRTFPRVVITATPAFVRNRSADTNPYVFVIGK